MGQSSILRNVLLMPRTLAAAILATGFSLTLALNLPGQLSYDSIAQLHDARTGIYNSWHPPVMAWILGAADAIVPGTSLYVVLVAALLFASFASLLWIGLRASWWCVALAAVCVALPQFLIYQGTVWKDVLFADSGVAGFVCVAHAGAHWRHVRLRFGLIAAGIALLVLAALARQNGAIALVFGIAAAGTLAAIAPSQGARNASLTQAGRGARFFTYAITASIFAAAAFFAASYALSLRTPGESGAQAQFKLLENYDLIGAVKDEPALKLDLIARGNPDLEELMRTDGVRLYTPERNDTLVGSAELQNELSDTQQSVLAAQWRELLLHHPLLYLKVRSPVFWWTFATPDITRCYPFYVGVQGLPRYMRELGIAARARPQDIALTQYGLLFTATPVFSHLTYAALAIAMLIVLLRRRRPPDIAMAFLLLSALAFTASFFVISIACDYRYLVFLDLSALTAAFYWTASRPKSA